MDENLTIEDIANANDWPRVTIATRKGSLTQQMPPDIFDDPPALAGLMRRLLDQVNREATHG